MTEPINETPEAVEASTRSIAKKSRKKIGVIVGVIAVVLVAAGASLWVWHEQPSFCGAICHTPMDNYLATYEAEPGQPTTDKWGNEVADASSMLAPVHRTEDGATCLTCHEPVMSQQISEGLNWVSGNYMFPLNERTTDQIGEPVGKNSDELCLNESCHHVTDDGTELKTRDDLIAATADMSTYNPHEAHHMELECGTCHKTHRASVNYCTQCHATAEVPEGWISMSQANEYTDID